MESSPTVLVRQSVVDMYDNYKKTRLLARIKNVVEQSFETHPMEHQTGAEEKRRTEICYMAFKELRNEHKYGFERSLDNIVRVLNTILDTTKFSTSKRAGWFAK